MKILLVAGFFPPYAPVSATRVNKMARYFLDRGHDVRVLAARNLRFPHVMAAEIPEDRIVYADVHEVLEFPARLRNRVKELFRPGPSNPSTPETQEGQGSGAGGSGNEPKKSGGFANWLRRAYQQAVTIPDGRVGWYPYAMRAGRELLADWQPDIIHASAPPHTGLLVAARLAREFDIPWICEYRDLWVDHPYYDGGLVRRFIESRMERRTLGTAAGLVTVTRTWADWLRHQYPDKPVELSMNGFDLTDYPKEDVAPLDPDRLTVIYAGGLYAGKRDPSPLFRALSLMGDDARRIKPVFHVVSPGPVVELAEAHGVEGLVEINGLVPRDEVIRRECAADVLLLLRWNDPSEDSVLAGKLFEYIGARRRILSIGSVTGEAADLIRDHDLGVVTNDPEEIAATLRRWLTEKGDGKLPPPSGDAASFGRPAQYARLEAFFRTVLDR